MDSRSMARKAKADSRHTRNAEATRISVYFAPADKKHGSTYFKPREPIPPKLRKFDPRIVELVRLLGRQTAYDVIEQAMKDKEADKASPQPEEE